MTHTYLPLYTYFVVSTTDGKRLDWEHFNTYREADEWARKRYPELDFLIVSFSRPPEPRWMPTSGGGK